MFFLFDKNKQFEKLNNAICVGWYALTCSYKIIRLSLIPQQNNTCRTTARTAISNDKEIPRCNLVAGRAEQTKYVREIQ